MCQSKGVREVHVAEHGNSGAKAAEANAFLGVIGVDANSTEIWTVTLLLNGQHTVEFRIGTRADVTVIPESLFIQQPQQPRD